MATQEQLSLLRASIQTWNRWRSQNRETEIDLTGAQLPKVYLREVNLADAHLERADLAGANLYGADLSGAQLTEAELPEANLARSNLHHAFLVDAKAVRANLLAANLSEADLRRADLAETILVGAQLTSANLSQADLRWSKLCTADLTRANLAEANLLGANLSKADLTLANLCEANLAEVNLRQADLTEADLRGADLSGADLREATLIDADLRGADLSHSICVGTDFTRTLLSGCRIHAMSSWCARLDGAEHQALRVTPRDEPEVVVDDLQVAQFVSLVLENEALSQVVEVSAKKLALILGGLSSDWQSALPTLSHELRVRHLVPMFLDCIPSTGSHGLEARVLVLARLSRFVLFDLTGAGLKWRFLAQAIAQLPSVVWQPFIQDNQTQTATWSDLERYSWVKTPYRYRDDTDFVLGLDALIGTGTGPQDASRQVSQPTQALLS